MVVPGNGLEISNTSGISEIPSAPSAILLNSHTGRLENRATSAKTTTAPRTPTTVKLTTGPTCNGKNPAEMPNRVTAATLTSAFAAAAPATREALPTRYETEMPSRLDPSSLPASSTSSLDPTGRLVHQAIVYIYTVILVIMYINSKLGTSSC